MVDQIHRDEPDTSEAVVRALLSDECPQWSKARLQFLDALGTDNAMWRATVAGGPDLVVRLPRRPGSAKGAELEYRLLQQLETTPLPSIVAVPKLLHIGNAHQHYPYRWSVLAWIDGHDAWTARHEIDQDSPRLGARLAEIVTAIGSLRDGLPVPKQADADSAHSIRPHVERLLDHLDRLDPSVNALFDVKHVRHLATEAYELEDPVTTCFLHNDLIPGNLLVREDNITGVLDWGAACYGDPARDLAPAWSILGPKGREAFRNVLLPDDSSWACGRALELCHAVDAVIYYHPRRHAISDVMFTTLTRILTDS